MKSCLLCWALDSDGTIKSHGLEDLIADISSQRTMGGFWSLAEYLVNNDDDDWTLCSEHKAIMKKGKEQ